MRRFILSLAVISAMGSFTASSLRAQDHSDLANAVIEACAGTESISCNFIQTRHLSLVNGEVISKGRMHYGKPDTLVWEYISPEPLSFEMKGSEVTVRRKGSVQSSDASGNRMYRELTNMLLGAVSGRLMADGKLFATEYSSRDGYTVVKMRPKKGDLKKMWNSMTMYFDEKSMKAVKIEIDETSGESTTIEFRY